VNAEKWRNRALIFMFGGFFIMYLGVYDKPLIPYLTVIGAAGVFAGIALYFCFGPVGGAGVKSECPRCAKVTRLSGAFDQCAHCGLPLRRTGSGEYEPYVP
jgi:hypothetical protein